MSINGQQLRRLFTLEKPEKAVAHLTEALEDGDLKPEDFSLRDLAEASVKDGTEYVRLLGPQRGGGLTLQEAEAVDTNAFANITGQIVYTKIMESYQSEEFSLTSIVPTVQTSLDGEKIPGVGKLGDETQVVGEAKPYPTAGVAEDYIETPPAFKRGVIVPVTKEAVFFDRTNLVLMNASKVGEAMGINKEKRIASVVIGATNNYKWKGTAYNTYQSSSPWINSHQNVLVDYTDIDNAEQLFEAMTDPNTGEPITTGATHIIYGPKLTATVRYVLNATGIRIGDGASTTVATMSPTPVDTAYTRVKSRYFDSQLRAAATADIPGLGLSSGNAGANWILCNPMKAFAYMQNWGITVSKAPQNAEKEFHQDIVHQYKVSERGVPVVLDPRYTVKNTH